MENNIFLLNNRSRRHKDNLIIDIIDEIDKKNNLTYEDFKQQYLDLNKPVIIQDASKNWLSHQKWNFGFFKKMYGKYELKINGNFYKFNNYIDLVLESTIENPAPYLELTDTLKVFPDLIFDLYPEIIYLLPDRLRSKMLPKFYEKNWGMRKRVVTLLIGGVGSGYSILHYDVFYIQAFVTQIRGDKEFILYPPTESKYLYPSSHWLNSSLIDNINYPNREKFPLFSKAKQIKILLKEGETIYIPSGWWHATKVVSPSIAVVNHWINPAKWSEFISSNCLQLNNKPIKRELLRFYLLGIGKFMTLNEKLGGSN